MENKKNLTKKDITATDAVYIIFTVIIGFCFIACAVVSLFLIICGCIWLVKSFSLESSKIFKALALDVLMLLSSALFVWLDVRIFFTVKNSISDYLVERKEILSNIAFCCSSEISIGRLSICEVGCGLISS